MAVLVTAIHAFELARLRDMGGRDKPGHDESGIARLA
jgi:hypothetical protein